MSAQSPCQNKAVFIVGIPCRSPRSGGRRRRRRRALRACSRINRSIRCRPHDMPSASRSCHPPGTIGPVARQEAGTNLGADILIGAAATTARSCQPGIESASRDTERSLQPLRRPDPRCFAIKPNFTSIPSRSRLRLFLECPVRPSVSRPRA
jgi:hypothetical protein